MIINNRIGVDLKAIQNLVQNDADWKNSIDHVLNILEDNLESKKRKKNNTDEGPKPKKQKLLEPSSMPVTFEQNMDGDEQFPSILMQADSTMQNEGQPGGDPGLQTTVMDKGIAEIKAKKGRMDGCFHLTKEIYGSTVIFEYKSALKGTTDMAKSKAELSARLQTSFYVILCLLYRAFTYPNVAHNIIAFICFGWVVHVVHYQIDTQKKIQHNQIEIFDLKQDKEYLKYCCLLTHLPHFIEAESEKMKRSGDEENSNNNSEDLQSSQPVAYSSNSTGQSEKPEPSESEKADTNQGTSGESSAGPPTGEYLGCTNHQTHL